MMSRTGSVRIGCGVRSMDVELQRKKPDQIEMDHGGGKRTADDAQIGGGDYGGGGKAQRYDSGEG